MNKFVNILKGQQEYYLDEIRLKNRWMGTVTRFYLIFREGNIKSENAMYCTVEESVYECMNEV